MSTTYLFETYTLMCMLDSQVSRDPQGIRRQYQLSISLDGLLRMLVREKIMPLTALAKNTVLEMRCITNKEGESF